MTKWEYCELGLRRRGEEASASLRFYRSRGDQAEEIVISWSQRVAELGLNGWELAGTMSTQNGPDNWTYDALIFKRPLQE